MGRRNAGHRRTGSGGRRHYLSGPAIRTCQAACARTSARVDHYDLQDYQIHAAENIGDYDRVVSIGMFEHVGRQQSETYFASIQKLPKPDSRAVIHSIVKDIPSRTNEWVDKYIFPSGYLP